MKGNENTRNAIRDELYDYYLPDFTVMETYNIDQFSFYLPDGTLFLQMHEPSIYGEKTDRYSVEYVNQEASFISGFEMRDTSNQYHFLFPLTYQGEHIGTVDFSISVTETLQELSHRFDNKDYMVIVETLN